MSSNSPKKLFLTQDSTTKKTNNKRKANLSLFSSDDEVVNVQNAIESSSIRKKIKSHNSDTKNNDKGTFKHLT